MIHVQIASELTPVGVEGVRWVLLESTDTLAPPGRGIDPVPAPVPAPVPEPLPEPVAAPAAAPLDCTAAAQIEGPGSAHPAWPAGPTADGSPQRPPSAPSLAAGTTPHAARAERSRLALGGLKLAVVGIGLMAALAWAQGRWGPPGVRWWFGAPLAVPVPTAASTATAAAAPQAAAAVMPVMPIISTAAAVPSDGPALALPGLQALPLIELAPEAVSAPPAPPLALEPPR